jgi:hypothetical protein
MMPTDPILPTDPSTPTTDVHKDEASLPGDAMSAKEKILGTCKSTEHADSPPHEELWACWEWSRLPTLQPVEEEKREPIYFMATGTDGLWSTLAPLSKLHQAVHDVMCMCGEPWDKCPTEGVSETVKLLDDSNEWEGSGEISRFSWHQDFEDGYISVTLLMDARTEPLASPVAQSGEYAWTHLRKAAIDSDHLTIHGATLHAIFQQLDGLIAKTTVAPSEDAKRIAELEAEVAKWKAQAFLPLGDNHHNARLCPYCSPESPSPLSPSVEAKMVPYEGSSFHKPDCPCYFPSGRETDLLQAECGRSCPDCTCPSPLSPDLLAGLIEVTKAQCLFCAGKCHEIWDGKMHPYDDGDVTAEPVRIDRQYVPNCGVMEGWVHQSGEGYVDCAASPIHDRIAALGGKR